uniref:Uncharacterized protein n=1 Tax=Anguilla anguilla TaxID=7936 RepID=A0A0E9VWV7_ANGAN
MAASPITWL